MHRLRRLSGPVASASIIFTETPVRQWGAWYESLEGRYV